MKAILKALGVLLLAVSCNQKKDLGDKVYVTRIKDLGYVTHIDRDCEKLKSAKGVKVIEAKELSELSLTCPECVSDKVRDTLVVFVERKLRRDEESKWDSYANPRHNFQKEVYDKMCEIYKMPSFMKFMKIMEDSVNLKEARRDLIKNYYMPSFEIFKEDFYKNNPELCFDHVPYSLNSVKYSIPLYKLEDFEKTFPEATTGIYVVGEKEYDYIFTTAEDRAEEMRTTPRAVFIYCRR